MGFFKRLFPQKAKAKVEPMRGIGKLQTDEEQESVRTKMEGEMSAAKDKRDGPTES